MPYPALYRVLMPDNKWYWIAAFGKGYIRRQHRGVKEIRPVTAEHQIKDLPHLATYVYSGLSNFDKLP